MSYRLLELPNMIITELSIVDNRCTIIFSAASIIKVMDAARQRTSWKQSGRIVVKTEADNRLDDPIENLPSKVRNGEFKDNVYLYYDTIRLPCHVYGNVGIRIEFVELLQPLDINGEEVEVILEGDPEYIAHID